MANPKRRVGETLFATENGEQGRANEERTGLIMTKLERRRPPVEQDRSGRGEHTHCSARNSSPGSAVYVWNY